MYKWKELGFSLMHLQYSRASPLIDRTSQLTDIAKSGLTLLAFASSIASGSLRHPIQTRLEEGEKTSDEEVVFLSILSRWRRSPGGQGADLERELMMCFATWSL